MTMHLAHPALTLSGKRKGKVKFRNAEEARRARELAEEWERKQTEWKSMSKSVTKKIKVTAVSTSKIPAGRSTKHIPSLDLGTTGAVSSKPAPQYTGTNVLGVTIVHKSCLQPVFSQQEAIDAAKMRR